MKQIAIIFTVAVALSFSANSAETSAERKVPIDGVEHTLEFISDLGDHNDMAPLVNRMREAYFQYYPSLIQWLGLPPEGTPKQTIVKFSSDIKHPGRTVGKQIEVSVAHLRRNPVDTEGLFIHELSHVIQAYKPGAPTWFTEGSADYVRFKAFPKSTWAQECRTHQTAKDQPFGHYWKSAAFLLWMEETHNKTIVQEISVHCRNGTYRADLWKELTGHDLATLAKEYAESAWQPPIK